MPGVYEDRDDAGLRLAEMYRGPAGDDVVVLGIPRGGVPVGYHLADSLGAVLDAIVVRKLPVPGNPEVGFGAVAPDGSVVLNADIVAELRLRQRDIDQITSVVLKEVNRREKMYRGDRPFPELKGKNVIVTDDGLATGYTMIAAIRMVKAREPAGTSVVVPVSPADTAARIEPLVDYFLCPNVSRDYSFAVARFYRDFHDMSDEEVSSCLRGE